MRVLESSSPPELGAMGLAPGQGPSLPLLTLSPVLPSLFLSSTPTAFLSPTSLPQALADSCPLEPVI